MLVVLGESALVRLELLRGCSLDGRGLHRSTVSRRDIGLIGRGWLRVRQVCHWRLLATGVAVRCSVLLGGDGRGSNAHLLSGVHHQTV